MLEFEEFKESQNIMLGIDAGGRGGSSTFSIGKLLEAEAFPCGTDPELQRSGT
jgi:hypothetical protein